MVQGGGTRGCMGEVLYGDTPTAGEAPMDWAEEKRKLTHRRRSWVKGTKRALYPKSTVYVKKNLY